MPSFQSLSYTAGRKTALRKLLKTAAPLDLSKYLATSAVGAGVGAAGGAVLGGENNRGNGAIMGGLLGATAAPGIHAASDAMMAIPRYLPTKGQISQGQETIEKGRDLYEKYRPLMDATQKAQASVEGLSPLIDKGKAYLSGLGRQYL